MSNIGRFIQKNQQNYSTHLYEASEGWGKYPEWKYARASAAVPGLSPRGNPKGTRSSSAEVYGRKPSRTYSPWAPESSIWGTCRDKLRERNSGWVTERCRMCRCECVSDSRCTDWVCRRGSCTRALGVMLKGWAEPMYGGKEREGFSWPGKGLSGAKRSWPDPLNPASAWKRKKTFMVRASWEYVAEILIPLYTNICLC